MLTKLRRIVFVLALNLPALVAQSTGTIQGTVTDPSGAAVPKAVVTVRNLATGETRSFTTDDSGLYVVPSLAVGHHSVSVKAAGMQATTVNDLVLEVGRTVEQDFHLALAAAATSVEISATAPVIDTSTTSVGTSVDQRTVQEIPLNGRHFLDLSLLTAGTVAPPATGYLSAPLRGQGSFAFFSAGNREDATNIMVNGINLNDMSQNQLTFQPSINTVQEFKVDNSTYSAQYGRNSGTIVNIATRSGTNALHGEIFEYLRNNYFDARNYFNRIAPPGSTPVPQSPFIRNNFGADAGGPIRHDKTFFFLSYEGLRQRQGLTINQQVLTADQRAAAAAAGNPTVVKLLPLIPQPNSGTGLFLGSAAAGVNIDQGTANLSHSISEKDRVSWYFAFQKDLRQEPTLGGNNIPNFGDTRQSHRQIMTINETHIFSPNIVNELRLGYNRIRIDFSPNALLNPADFGMAIGITAPIGLPQISFKDIGLNLGGPSNFPQGRGDYTAVLSDTVSYLRGKHSLKFGGEVRRFDGNSYLLNPGTMQFNSVSDFINGNIVAFTSNTSSNPSRIFILATGAFVEDSYKVSRDLTLQLGFRWEWNGTPTEAQDRFVLFDPTTSSLVKVHHPYQQNHSWEPRLGFAWDVFHNGKTVVRSAYAIMADQPTSGLVSGLASNPPFATPLTYNGPPFVSFTNALTVAKGSGLNPVSVASDFTTPYVQSWNFNIQQQIASDLGVMVGYFGNKGTHLRTALNINQLTPGSTVRPFPLLPSGSIDAGTALGNISQYESVGNSEYNGLWITATKRLSKGLQFNTFYTWAKSMDETSYNSPQNIAGSVITPMQDSTNLRADHAPSDFDVRHRFVVSGIYELPFKGNRVVEGWQFSLINQLQSGNPLTIITTNNATGVTNAMRPNILGPVPVGIGSAANGNPQYFPSLGCGVTATPNCLFQVVKGFGNLGRNTIVGPGFEDVDLALYKDTRITEKLRAQFRADTFNIFNHPNLAQPNRTVSTAATNTFGQILATRSPIGDSGSSRQIQLALKLIF